MNWIVFGQAGGAPGGFDPTLLLVIGATLAIFYVMLIRPQRKQQNELKKAVEALKKGDRIMTTGGIFGTVVGLKESILVLKIADEVKIEILKSAVASVVNKNE